MTDRPDILYVANMRLPSEKAHSVHVMEMCAALSGQGVQVTLLVPDRKTNVTGDPFDYYGVSRTFEIVRLPSFDAFRLSLPRALAYYLHAWSFARSVLRFAKNHPEAMIISRDLYSAYRLARKGRRVAFEVHDTPSPRVGPMLRAIPRIITTNNWKRKELIERFGVAPHSILVAPNAVDVRKFRVSVQPSDLPAGKAGQGKIVLYAGHLFPWKGVETLARAARFLDSGVRLVVAGGTEEDRARFQEFLEQENLPVTLLPHRPHAEMPKLLASASVLVLPTSAKFAIGREQTSPIKAFEYLAVGKPIVASDVPSSREVFGGETAIYFKPDDPRDCARAIRDALAMDDRRRQAMMSVQNAFIASRTWEARAKEILAFISLCPVLQLRKRSSGTLEENLY